MRARVFVLSAFLLSGTVQGAVTITGGQGAGYMVDGIGGAAQFSTNHQPGSSSMSGGGSTSGGFGGIFATITMMGPTFSATELRWQASGSAQVLAGQYIAYTLDFYTDFEVDRPTTFQWDQAPPFLTPSSFSGLDDEDGVLDVGTSYRLSMNLDRALGHTPATNFTLWLTQARTCPCDLNLDDFVDDVDFPGFAAAYDILDCGSFSMPAGCPADFNADGIVDDSDFVLFASAYEQLTCP